MSADFDFRRVTINVVSLNCDLSFFVLFPNRVGDLITVVDDGISSQRPSLVNGEWFSIVVPFIVMPAYLRSNDVRHVLERSYDPKLGGYTRVQDANVRHFYRVVVR